MSSSFVALDMETPAVDLAALKKLIGVVSGADNKLVDVVEVGSWVGRTALAMLDTKKIGLLFCVDHWQGSLSDVTSSLVHKHGQRTVFETFCKNIGAVLGTLVMPCVGPSLMWASVWQRPLDLVFIDASHDYEDVRSDIKAWWPHVRGDGGILCGHDYSSRFAGVRQAADEFDLDGVIGSVWFKRKHQPLW